MRIHWAGWETDTYRLQQAGWELSAANDPSSFHVQLAMRHKALQVEGMSDHINVRDLEDFRGHVVEVGARLAHRFTVTSAYGREMVGRFNPIDATPTVVERPSNISIGELGIFKTVQRADREIYLSEASMSQVMDAALSLQDPRQEEIRQRMMIDQGLEKMRRDSSPAAELRLVI